MQSHTSAAKLFETCDSVAAAAPLMDGLGFGVPLIPLSRAHREKLGLPAQVAVASVANGQGALRALVAETSRDPRETLDAIVRGLAATPSLLWIILVIAHDGVTALAAIDSSSLRHRAALLAVERSNVLSSDCETLCAMAAVETETDILTHLRWIEILGRDSVGRRFFRVLDAKVHQLADTLAPSAPPGAARALALLCTSRLLFLSFLETRGWLNRDRAFLSNGYADCMVGGGRYHQRVLSPLFFGTLNTAPPRRARRARAFGKVPFLNGGLFARSPIERQHSEARFSDVAIGDLYGDLLTRFRFTAKEESSAWSESAIDPEMLGKAFEGLMSSSERKQSGAFYTPQSLVSDVTRGALLHALEPNVPRPCAELAMKGELPARVDRERLAVAIDQLRVLDPACGSGAFLVFALEELSRLRFSLGGRDSLHAVRRKMLTQSIFGVDVSPTAVWLCELRLWLSMAIEDPETDPMRVTPLPNLDRNIRVGDSLTGDDFRGAPFATAGRMTLLRARYSRATGPRKKTLSLSLDALERAAAVSAGSRMVEGLMSERREILIAARARDLFGGRNPPDTRVKARLSSLRLEIESARAELHRARRGGALPFSFAASFPDVAASGGFHLVIGNPPWIRTHNLEKSSRARLRRRYEVYANAAWRGGSDAAAAGRGFASQVDSAALFIERSLSLLREQGVMSLVVPAKLWRSLAGGGVREFLLTRSALLEMHDLSSSSLLFDAAVYPSVLVSRRVQSGNRGGVEIVSHRGGKPGQWRVRPSALSLDASTGSPWILAPPGVRLAFDALRASGRSLTENGFSRPLLGVKTGCNEAFLLDEAVAESEGVELTRPVVRGEALTPWRVATTDARIIWPHDASGAALESLPAGTARWLRRWRRELELRVDARNSTQWWTLFRTESADFSKARVIWADIARRPRAAVLPANDRSLPLNTCYAVQCPTLEDAHALAALVNSGLIARWLSVIAEPARGGYRRYMGWTMSLLPLPHDWPAARGLLAPIGADAAGGDTPDDDFLSTTVMEAFGMEPRLMAPLLGWSE